jgi:hypothetical protein
LVAGSSGTSETMIAGGFGIVAEPGKPLGQASKLLSAPQLIDRPRGMPQMPFMFEWQELEGAKNYRLQLLVTVAGEDAILVDEFVPSTKVQWDALPEGAYTFRLRGVDEKGLEGANVVQRFTYNTRPVPPVLNTPANQAKSSAEKVFFRWDAAPEAQEYLFQLAEDAEFKNLVASVPNISQQTRGVLIALPANQYFWRVASIDKDGKLGPFSDALTFTQLSSSASKN